MPAWTNKDFKKMLREKKKNPRMTWEKVSELLGHSHSPNACYRKYLPYAPKMKNPLTTAERRKIAKLRNKQPPCDFKEIAKLLPGVSTKECRSFYENHATAKEIARGIREAQADQKVMDAYNAHHASGAPEQPKYYPQTHQRWTTPEVNQLMQMRQEQQMPWAQVSNQLDRSIRACSSKYHRLKQQDMTMNKSTKRHRLDEENEDCQLNQQDMTMNKSTKRRRNEEEDQVMSEPENDTAMEQISKDDPMDMSDAHLHNNGYVLGVVRIKVEPFTIKKRKIAKPITRRV